MVELFLRLGPPVPCPGRVGCNARRIPHSPVQALPWDKICVAKDVGKASTMLLCHFCRGRDGCGPLGRHVLPQLCFGSVSSPVSAVDSAPFSREFDSVGVGIERLRIPISCGNTEGAANPVRGAGLSRTRIQTDVTNR